MGRLRNISGDWRAAIWGMIHALSTSSPELLSQRSFLRGGTSIGNEPLREESFSATLSSAQKRAASRKAVSRRSGGNSSPVDTNSTAVSQSYVTPFNPYGFPPATKPAPTTAEVAANPEAYRGTSFDPAIQIQPTCLMMAAYGE